MPDAPKDHEDLPREKELQEPSEDMPDIGGAQPSTPTDQPIVDSKKSQ
ncbi:MAG: hypothetical protein Q8L05_09985 [Actinomycetota bacterium]|nr:hypothetical protein [Actinomycetota bacterium]MDP2289414.1 hypothetical protein [Actinomycetota bacterium]